MTNKAISVLKEKKAEIENEIKEKKLQIERLEKDLMDIDEGILNLLGNKDETISDSEGSYKSSKTISQVLKEDDRSMNLTEITRRVVEDKKLDLKRNAVGAALNRLVKKGMVRRYETKPTTWSIP